MNFNSNHPFLIKREFLSMIQRRLTLLSKTEEIFEKIKIPYKNTLKNSCFKTSLSYVKDITKKKQRLRKKKVFYYNSPFCNDVKTDIGKEFLKLVTKHFPKQVFTEKFSIEIL